MTQQTLQLADDCRRIEEILKSRDVLKEIRLVYEGNNSRNSFNHTMRREFNESGYPLIHAQEIYGNPEYSLPEKRTYLALNELVKHRKVKTYVCEGLFWYAWDPAFEDSAD